MLSIAALAYQGINEVLAGHGLGKAENAQQHQG
jgi:hypothetical protein